MNDSVALEGFGGGGGAALNFKVVGNPQPASPKENTIWVNTDVDITGWCFAAEQPENMAEGEVWISTGTASQVAFNALKKGTVMVYPISAKQMVGGSLVDKTAKSYQNGAWVDWWNGELYDNGNQWTGVTGGWSSDNYTAELPIVSGTHDATRMTFQGQSGKYCMLGEQKATNLSGKNQIRCVGNINSNYNDQHGLTLIVCKTMNLSDDVANLRMITVGPFDSFLDISSLDGEYFITIRAEGANQISGYVTEVKLL